MATKTGKEDQKNTPNNNQTWKETQWREEGGCEMLGRGEIGDKREKTMANDADKKGHGQMPAAL